MAEEEKDGLLANAQPEETVTEEPETTTTTPPDGTPPVDAPQRPEYIPENFWNQEKGEVNLEGMAKSYAEMRKAFNEKNNDKPGETIEEYMTDAYFDDDGKFKSETMEIMKDDPGLNAAFQAAKDAGLGVKQTHEFINKFIDGMKDFMPQPVDIQTELSKLGNNAEKLVTGLKTWIDGMQTNGDIDAEVHSAMLELGKTAAGIKALDVLRQKTGEMTLPIGEALSGTTHMSLKDWYSATYETHAESGESRAAFRDRMHELGKKLIGKGHGTYDGSGYGVRCRH
jgi:hypothetical protein